MAVDHKFMIFFMFTIVYLAKTERGRNDFPPYDFKNYSSINSRLQKSTTIPPWKWTPQPSVDIPTIPPTSSSIPCIHKSHVFSFSNVGLQKIGRDFINSNDIINLSLDNNNISYISPFAFRNMRNLKYLNLSGNKIPKEKLLSLAGNARLQTLIIDNNQDFHNPVTETLKEYEVFQSLKHLHLCNSQLGNFQVHFYLAMPILTHLYLKNNSISSTDAIFDNIPATLTHLYLNQNLIDRVKQGKLRY